MTSARAPRTGRLTQYRGELSAADLAEGMNAAAKNAIRLYDDATILLRAGSFATSVSIAVLALEEAGKIAVLRGMCLADGEKQWRNMWRAYRDHTSKHVGWSFRSFPMEFTVPNTEHHPALFDTVKQYGIYTDCLQNRVWIQPTEFMSEQTARDFVGTSVKNMLAPLHRKFTAREVEIWREYMGPAWKKDPQTVGDALVRWGAALQAEGLGAAFDLAGSIAFVRPDGK